MNPVSPPSAPFDISYLVEQVSLQNINATVQRLIGYSTRFAFSSETIQVRQWLRRQFIAMGYADVVYQDFVLCDSLQRNVICTKAGRSNRVIILCAHYDSTAKDTVGWDWQKCPAPGANDNASGVAAVLELARILRGIDTGCTIRFIAFAGEEQGLWGSRAYAEHALANQMDIALIVNLDEIGCPDSWSVVIGKDQGSHTPAENPASHEFAEVMMQAAADYTTLTSRYADIWASDLMPFNSAGYAVVGVCQAGKSPHSHEVTDIYVDAEYVAEVTRMVLAAVMRAAER